MDHPIDRSRKSHLPLIAIVLVVVVFVILHVAAAVSIFRAGFDTVSFKNPFGYLAIALFLVLAIFKLTYLLGLKRRRGKRSVLANGRRTYLPAAGRDWLLPFYDVMAKVMGADQPRRTLLDQAKVKPGHRVLDLGCGTGSLAIELKRLSPETDVVGLDPDPKALARARRKAARAAVSIQLDQGFGDELPYPEASFDRVFSSLMFHHLPADQKGPTLQAVRRVLKSGGEFHMLDFEGPEHAANGFLSHLLHSSERLKDNSENRVLSLIAEAGFVDARKVDHRRMLFGHVAYYRATAWMPGL
jgi:ubiquinone/menaquinone biosynthesis C-methylase UbiE